MYNKSKGKGTSNPGDDWEALRAMFPTNFGMEKPKKKYDWFEADSKKDKDKKKEDKEEDNNNKKDKDKTEITEKSDIPLKEDLHKNQESDQEIDEKDDNNNSDSDSDSDMELNYKIPPISHEVKLEGHTKMVSALSLDPSGSRLATGSYDNYVKLWDFNGMDMSLRSFRTIEPEEGNQIVDLKFSITGDQILIATNGSMPRLYDRDGILIEEYIKGDPYLQDMRKTKGHIQALSSCMWHPYDKQVFMTSAADSTVRLWDVNQKRSHKDIIVVKSKNRGTKTRISSACFNLTATNIAVGAQDGIIRIYDPRSISRPSITIEEAHMSGSDIGSLEFSRDGRLLLSRATDDTLKLWDIRHESKPLFVQRDLNCFYAETNAIFSPDEQYVLTGTSVKKEDGPGQLKIYYTQGAPLDLNGNNDNDNDDNDNDHHHHHHHKKDKKKNKKGHRGRSFDEAYSLEVGRHSVVKLLWHQRINQILVGNGDGATYVLYDPEKSINGAKLCANKQPRRKKVDEYEFISRSSGQIYTPHAIYKEGSSGNSKRKREKLRNDPIASHHPEMPLNGPGRGGRVGTNYTHYMMKHIMKDTTHDEDPREALLSYAKKAEENPYFIAPAYKKNQPKPVFDESELDEEELNREVKRRA
ncbi:WD40 repeat-like protein [Anaeromyces robustus]|uniref:WD40 repeat-like protein n=1 Tax=Anaeromyces robustus TaxID=1754192 RepID=A0A1Y1VTF3_9FUNG|nr:WD40 repeat-like protein [Anaeromyces robustus]|eukprot:ORX64582.1 WD40 repeat-like protein [Anaeromyces robustus]